MNVHSDVTGDHLFLKNDGKLYKLAYIDFNPNLDNPGTPPVAYNFSNATGLTTAASTEGYTLQQVLDTTGNELLKDGYLPTNNLLLIQEEEQTVFFPDGTEYLIVDASNGTTSITMDASNTIILGDSATVQTISYDNLTEGVEVDLGAGQTYLVSQNGSGSPKDIFDHIENAAGTNFADEILGDNAANVLSGDDGDDILDGGAGNDSLYGGRGNDKLTGSTGDDLLYDSSGDNILDGGDGNDSLYGGSGNDMLDGGAGNNQLDGGDGIDTATYATLGEGITVDLTWYSGEARLVSQPSVVKDTLSDIEHIIGTGFDDTIIGNGGSTSSILEGGDGDDVLKSQGSTDILTGGIGADTFRTLARIETIITDSTAEDSIVVPYGHFGVTSVYVIDDDVFARNGYGTFIFKNATLDDVRISGGKTKIFGTDAAESIVGGAGNDIIYGGDGNDTIVGGDGEDTLFGGSGDDSLTGGGGSDRYIITPNPNATTYITDFKNADSYIDLRGFFSLIPSTLELYFRSQIVNGNTEIDLGSGQMLIVENRISLSFTLDFGIRSPLAPYDDITVDATLGTNLSETITGGADDGVIIGGAGDDLIHYDGSAATGEHNVFGADGDDTIHLTPNNLASVNGGSGTDTLWFSSTQLSTTLSTSTFSRVNGIEILRLTGATDYTFTLDFTLDSGIYSSLSDHDEFTIDATATELVSVNIDGSAVSEDITFLGSAGDDNFIGSGPQDTLYGNAGNDTLIGGSGDGGSGDDVLIGSNGSDTLYGGAGNDTLMGGSGIYSVFRSNTLIGGEGTDTVQFEEIIDNFTFTLNYDNAIEVGNSGYAGSADKLYEIELLKFLETVGGSTYVTYTLADLGITITNHDPNTFGTISDVDIITDSTVTILTASQISYRFYDSDFGDTLTFSLAGGAPSWLAIDGSGNLVATNPDSNETGDHIVSLLADDGNGGTPAQQSFTIAIS
ncbi:MAG: hypothetical protein KUG81_10450, partial [Gammaproteobacteria bacterium]|nr:hypothetical protein [Gammaproteobacteria bacterium]